MKFEIFTIYGTNSDKDLIGALQGARTCNKTIDPANFSDGNWHFLVGVWSNNNTVITYYDGVPFTSTGSYAQSNSYINLGGISDGPQYYFIGDLSDIRVYSEALTEAEVMKIYKWGKQYLELQNK